MLATDVCAKCGRQAFVGRTFFYLTEGFKRMSVEQKSLAQEWDELAAIFFEGFEPSDMQRNDMRRAYYAGCLVMFTKFNDAGEEGRDEEEGVAIVDAIAEELKTYCEEVRLTVVRQRAEEVADEQ